MKELFDVNNALRIVLEDIDDYGLSFDGAYENLNHEWFDDTLTSIEYIKVKDAYRRYLDKERVDALKTKNEAKFTYIMECIKEIYE